MERREGTQRNTNDQRQTESTQAELQSHRESLSDQFGDRKVLVFERRSEITVRESCKVTSELRPDRLVQSVSTLQVGHDFGRQRLLLIERTAGRGAHQKESQRDNDQQRGNCAGQTRQEVANHRG